MHPADCVLIKYNQPDFFFLYAILADKYPEYEEIRFTCFIINSFCFM